MRPVKVAVAAVGAVVVAGGAAVLAVGGSEEHDHAEQAAPSGSAPSMLPTTVLADLEVPAQAAAFLDGWGQARRDADRRAAGADGMSASGLPS